MNPHLQRGYLLYSQGRHTMAEEEFRQALATEPGEAQAHAMIALCLAEQQKFEPAIAEARQSIGLQPDAPMGHYSLARVAYLRDDYPLALSSIDEAIRLDPADSDFHALRAGVYFDQKQWAEALASCEQGLQFDPEHIGCNNLRSMSLVKLGRLQEAGSTIQATLARNPDNAITHANQGWAYLEQGEREKALEHFREALRIDPTCDWARSGIVEALKAGNIIYAVMLKYFLWMSKLSDRAQWGILVGGYFASRALGAVAKQFPTLAPWILPLRILYVLFVFLTWTADPLFNLFLRLNRYGRLALSDAQRVASNWIGSCLGIAIVSLILSLLLGIQAALLVSAAVFLLLVIPLSAVFRCPSGWPKKVMIAITTVLTVLGSLAITTAALCQTWNATNHDFYEEMTVQLLGVFSLGIIASSWGANLLVTRRPRKP